MKFTRRQSGKLMATVQVTHYIGLARMIDALIIQQEADQPYNPVTSRNKVIQLTKHLLRDVGAHDDLEFAYDLFEQFEEQAKENVLRLFPELEGEQ